ncbi:coiled-coil domain-containing protein 115 [Cynoglossus semilaevis]|uniref:Vacuolar ATPase assembly protein VMA22 n=1 Tax=Cynoglossus semilaevis TaxID=244447 RepID=A0A3P8UCM8_CYNSE|nr:coiled-coil domain-containing protein 115 [Cynoglossus semilaevis]
MTLVECSENVDEKLLLLMEQLQLLEEKRNTLNTLIEQGWLSMSKARYSMGNKQVSTLQYASEMEPLVRIHVRSQDSGGSEVEFNTVRLETGKDVTSVEDIGPQEEGVRKRTRPKGETATEKQESDKLGREKVPEKKNQVIPQQDPLRWFGILVPQSLRHAQMSFKQVIELSAEIASLQVSLLNTKRELRNRLQDKQAVQKETQVSDR